MTRIVKTACMFVAMILVLGCPRGDRPDRESAVLYCALDQIFSESILKGFATDSGHSLKPVFDTEATKTVGLVNRIIAEESAPQCDVFWNNEIVRTIVLKKKGLLTPYVSRNAGDIPPLFKDEDGYWTGFAARARVLIYNKNLLNEEDLPASIFDLVKPEWKGKVAMALPLFGTTASHAAALFATLGDEKALEFYRDLKANDVRIVSGNATARDVVVRGEYPIAFTDTDDAYVALAKGMPVGIIFPDQGDDGIGTLLIPNTVSLIKGGPNPDAGKKLIDYLVSAGTEEALALCGSAQIPLRPGLKVADGAWTLGDVKAQNVDWEAVAGKMEPVAAIMREMFVQ